MAEVEKIVSEALRSVERPILKLEKTTRAVLGVLPAGVRDVLERPTQLLNGHVLLADAVVGRAINKRSIEKNQLK